MNIKPGDTYCQLGQVKRFHIFTFVDEYKGRLLFFDAHTYEIFLITYKAFEKAIEAESYHPDYPELRMFDFVETLPDDVFGVIKAHTEASLKEKEPEILDIFATCVKN